jgi:hypothetical protein
MQASTRPRFQVSCTSCRLQLEKHEIHRCTICMRRGLTYIFCRECYYDSEHHGEENA